MANLDSDDDEDEPLSPPATHAPPQVAEGPSLAARENALLKDEIEMMKKERALATAQEQHRQERSQNLQYGALASSRSYAPRESHYSVDDAYRAITNHSSRRAPSQDRSRSRDRDPDRNRSRDRGHSRDRSLERERSRDRERSSGRARRSTREPSQRACSTAGLKSRSSSPIS